MLCVNYFRRGLRRPEPTISTARVSLMHKQGDFYACVLASQPKLDAKLCSAASQAVKNNANISSTLAQDEEEE